MDLVTLLAACALNVHVASYHNEPGFNTMTPGLGVLCETSYEDVRAGAGFYRNSIDHTSVYVGAAWQPLHLGPVRLGAFAGLITGYQHKVDGFAAAVGSLPVTQRTTLHLIAIPSVKGTNPLTVSLSIEHRF